MNQTIIDTIAPRLTELVIKKIETLTGDWQKPWIADMTHGLPRNLRGTPYRAGNVLMLLFLSEIMGYGTPVFMTFRQAKEEGLNIRKGSDAFPVYFWKMYVRHKETRKKIESAEYYRLPKEQQKHYDLIPVMRYYPVFNLDQTDMQEQQPERYAQLDAQQPFFAHPFPVRLEPPRILRQPRQQCAVSVDRHRQLWRRALRERYKRITPQGGILRPNAPGCMTIVAVVVIGQNRGRSIRPPGGAPARCGECGRAKRAG